MADKVIELDKIVVKFSGDSGDGMQLTGSQFSDTSAFIGEDIATFPDYPAEIRAPRGTIGGVSGFQIHFGESVDTPGDDADVFIAMNPAAFAKDIRYIKKGGIIIVDKDSFTPKNIEKAGCTEDPLQNQRYGSYNIIESPITSLTKKTLNKFKLDTKSILKSRNMFALGMVYWMFHYPLDYSEEFLDKKFSKKPGIAAANKAVLRSGYHHAENIHAMPSYRVLHAKIEKGTYRTINGNIATAWGLIAAAEKAKLKLFCGSYPITPATEILQELAARKDLGVITFQAEDEIAGICTAIGASFTGSLGVTTTSGPGLALKGEAIGLTVMMELPLVIVNVQRGGPSTGLPTKTEQADLFQALFGRNGESPVVVIAATSPSNCFHYAFMAAKIALERMTPVILLTDGYLANGSSPWKIPRMTDLPSITPPFATSEEKYQPYKRDPGTLARKWAVAGTKDMEHRIGGLEKMAVTGDVSYIPENHEFMIKERAGKVQRVSNLIPPQKITGKEKGELLVVGWGGTFGHLLTAIRELHSEGIDVSFSQFSYIFPLPKNTEEIFKGFKKILVCELNLGQFYQYLRMELPQFNYLKYNKIKGIPFTVKELKDYIKEMAITR